MNTQACTLSAISEINVMKLCLRANLIYALVFVLYAIYVNTETVSRPKLVPYSIPENRELKKSVGYDEDTYLNFTELTSKYRYTTEQHTVITQDGYILTLFRILPQCFEVRLLPVLLMHGILDSSDLWIVAGPETGLGYILANNCHDVWVGNHRGNRYSRRHVRLNPDTDVEYWNYSFDEHGNYDLPALVDYILRVRKQRRLNYIGHSQGTTDFFVMSSLRPEYNKKIKLSIHLAPVTWLANIKSPLPKLIAQLTEPIRAFVEAAGYSEILAKDQIIHSVIEVLCQIGPDSVCSNILTMFTGHKLGSVYSKTLSISFGHLLVGISVKNLAHLGQLIISGNFQRYDEGTAGNIKRYGTPKPPKYNVSKISSPVVLINAYNDWLSTTKDIDILCSRLPNLVENYIVPEKYWSHHNHVWGIKAPTFVFPKILQYFQRFDIYT